MQKTERLVAITLLLQARGKMTAERLARIFEVSTRTIYRDMDSLSMAHVPVSMDYGPGGGYFLPDDYRLTPSTFTSEEAVALALGGTMAGGFSLFESDEGLRRALFKLEAALPEEYRQDVKTVRERILFDTSGWRSTVSPPKHLETVRAAVWSARQLDLLYPSRNREPRWRRAEPHGLVCKAGVWYLAAYCQLRRDFRTFRVDRIQNLRVREDTVTPRPSFDLESYWKEARERYEEMTRPPTIRLRAPAGTLHLLWRENVTLYTESEEGEEAIIRAEVQWEGDLIPYILSLGPYAVVVDPPEICERVAAAVRQMAVHYGAFSQLHPA